MKLLGVKNFQEVGYKKTTLNSSKVKHNILFQKGN